MTIGELLKDYRIQQRKTQKEWVGDVISSSFYAKVEKNISRISADDLLAILNHNNISIVDFFSELNKKRQSKYDQERDLIHLINDAYYRNSKAELLKIRKVISENDFPNQKDDLLYIDAYIADVDNEDLNEEEKELLKDKIFSSPSFDKATLLLYCNFMMFYDLESNLLICRNITKQVSNSNDVKVQTILLSIIANLVIQCIENKKYDETKYFIAAADQIETKPELFFYKNVLVMLKNMINYQYDRKEAYLNQCTKAIDNCAFLGMPEYGEELAKFFKKNKR
ncbi:Rgg/GadR/MutR family transcriptional regulator [Lactobacillus sp. ESL0684]|uniref:helix-turn-helix domain-containing protein n=1 Tax=Lactobacillus sp. ESL0684 TaxID=2983213 RepID=UPI0023F7B743|nr:Rgg/GadR/MutR family transcriptional regulator [Lactobacillus sp. ESL0684]WEV43728.1 Rgg/GadR/MutR family transcriptional regulator [Lactobacillus sp. ESL0684]